MWFSVMNLRPFRCRVPISHYVNSSFLFNLSGYHDLSGHWFLSPTNSFRRWTMKQHVCASLSVCLCLCLCKTFSYLWIQTSEVHETLPVLLLCQWELVYQFSEKFTNFFYPLPIIFVVVFYWTQAIYTILTLSSHFCQSMTGGCETLDIFSGI